MKYPIRAAVAVFSSLLVACGGGGDSAPDTPEVTNVKVVGASLADSGTFGYKFTVQPGVEPAYSVYTEQLAMHYRLTTFCSAYTFQTTSTSFLPKDGCTNFAVAGAKINNFDATYGGVLESVPMSMIKQLVDLGNKGFVEGDLLVVGEGSANDTAALTSAYVDEAFSGGSGFSSLVATLLSAETMAAHAGDPATLGGLYMQALADKLVAAVKTNALDKGATRIALLNTLDITMTPRFQAMLDDIAAASSEETAGNVQTMVESWIQAFNARLASAVEPYANNMIVVDFYTGFNERIHNPANYQLSNVTATVCDEVVTGGKAPGDTSLSSPSVVAACTDQAAYTMTPPLGSTGTAGWWQSYLFADSFHPTPYGHALLYDIVAARLDTAGWL